MDEKENAVQTATERFSLTYSPKMARRILRKIRINSKRTLPANLEEFFCILSAYIFFALSFCYEIRGTNEQRIAQICSVTMLVFAICIYLRYRLWWNKEKRRYYYGELFLQPEEMCLCRFIGNKNTQEVVHIKHTDDLVLFFGQFQECYVEGNITIDGNASKDHMRECYFLLAFQEAYSKQVIDKWYFETKEEKPANEGAPVAEELQKVFGAQSSE